MDTRFIESFLAVVELGSMAEAARRLGLSPAAVAQRVRTLESEVGTTLLVRNGRYVRPTKGGVAIMERGSRILRDVRDLRAAACDREVVGEIRLGAISTAVTGLLPGILKRLVVEAPGLDVFVVPGTSAELYSQIDRGTLDVAILVEPQFALPKTLEWRLLRTEPLIVLGPSTASARDPYDLLRTEPFIRYDRNNWGGRLADGYLQKAGITPRERLELDSLEAIAIMVDRDMGVSLVPDWAPPWPAGLDLAKVSLAPDAPQRRIGLLRSRSTPRRAATDLLSAIADQTKPD